MEITEQIALAAIFYFEQVFVFWGLINKNVLEWFLLKMWKEISLRISTKILSSNHPTWYFWLRVRLHVTQMKSHPRIKKILFTREFHPGMKRVVLHPGWHNLKENLPLSMKTYNKIYHFFSIIETKLKLKAWYVKNISRLLF